MEFTRIFYLFFVYSVNAVCVLKCNNRNVCKYDITGADREICKCISDSNYIKIVDILRTTSLEYCQHVRLIELQEGLTDSLCDYFLYKRKGIKFYTGSRRVLCSVLDETTPRSTEAVSSSAKNEPTSSIWSTIGDKDRHTSSSAKNEPSNSTIEDKDRQSSDPSPTIPSSTPSTFPSKELISELLRHSKSNAKCTSIRTYPILNSANTFVSNQYFTESKEISTSPSSNSYLPKWRAIIISNTVVVYSVIFSLIISIALLTCYIRRIKKFLLKRITLISTFKILSPLHRQRAFSVDSVETYLLPENQYEDVASIEDTHL